MISKSRQQFIDEVLGSLDGAQRAEPRPFFYTRLQARLEKVAGPWEKIVYLLARPVIAYSLIAAIVLLNSYFLVINNPRQDSSALETQVTEEIDFPVATIYDLETPEPHEQ